MFGYRNLGFGSHPNRTVADAYTGSFTWSTTLTLGHSEIKGGHHQYGYDTKTMNNNAAIGSLSDSTIDGMWDNDHADTGSSYPNEDNEVSLISCIYYNASGTDYVAIKFAADSHAEAYNQHSNVATRTIDGNDFSATWDTIVINGVTFSQHNQVYNRSATPTFDYRYSWTAANPFGTTSTGGTFTVTVSSQGWTAL